MHLGPGRKVGGGHRRKRLKALRKLARDNDAPRAVACSSKGIGQVAEELADAVRRFIENKGLLAGGKVL